MSEFDEGRRLDLEENVKKCFIGLTKTYAIPCQISEDIMYGLSKDGYRLKYFINSRNSADTFHVIEFEKPIQNVIIDRNNNKILLDFSLDDLSLQQLQEIFENHKRRNLN